MKSEEHCRDWKLFLIRINPKPGERCHICLDVFKVNSFINWHPDQLCGCHKECRDGLLKPESIPRQEPIPVKVKTYSVTEKKLTYPNAYQRWTPDDDLRLEKMWSAWKSVPEIMQALNRSEYAIRYRVRIKKINELTDRPLPPTEKQFRLLERLGCDEPKPSTPDKAWELANVWFEKPTSLQLESELKATGYDGPTPETNSKTKDKINAMRWPKEPITESQTRKIKQICQLIGEEVGELPTNKWEASLLIDRLIKKAVQMDIDIPRLTKRKMKKKRSTSDYEYEGGDEDDYWNSDDDENDSDDELSFHETDDDKRGDEDPSGTLTDVGHIED